MQVRVTENKEQFGTCGCGRSPTGKCIGWHGLSEEEYKTALANYQDEELEAYKRQAQELWNDSCTSPRKN